MIIILMFNNWSADLKVSFFMELWVYVVLDFFSSNMMVVYMKNECIIFYRDNALKCPIKQAYAVAVSSFLSKRP